MRTAEAMGAGSGQPCADPHTVFIAVPPDQIAAEVDAMATADYIRCGRRAAIFLAAWLAGMPLVIGSAHDAYPLFCAYGGARRTRRRRG